MALTRTTLMLDVPTRRAARDLAKRYECSVSEAIRRAVVQQQQQERGPTPDTVTRRQKALRRLFVLFNDHDAAAELLRLKKEDEGF